MIDVAEFFSQSYAEARAKFLAAAEDDGLTVESHVHPLLGRDGETLAMDVVRVGPPDAKAVLMLSSACHGVEGFCGSGIQNALLHDQHFHDGAIAAGVAVLHIHALNPYGFSWWRRATNENVDLNRNFHDFSAPLPPNPGYELIAHALVPTTWPPTPANESVLADYLAVHGPKGLQQAVTAGQHTHSQGLFYGGVNPTWSQQTLRQVLRQHGRQCERLAWIDFHTGLGPAGLGERIFSSRDDAGTLARAKAWWGPKITSIYEGSASSARLTGMMFDAAYQECPQAEYTGIALEYGTVPLEDTIVALRAEHWLEAHPEASAEQAAGIKQDLRDVFYTDTDEWKTRVLEQGFEVSQEAVDGLSGKL